MIFHPSEQKYIREHFLERLNEITDAVVDAFQTQEGQVGEQSRLTRAQRIAFMNDLLQRGVFNNLVPIATDFANKLARQYSADVEKEGLT